jgi:hypothetical protein
MQRTISEIVTSIINKYNNTLTYNTTMLNIGVPPTNEQRHESEPYSYSLLVSSRTARAVLFSRVSRYDELNFSVIQICVQKIRQHR